MLDKFMVLKFLGLVLVLFPALTQGGDVSNAELLAEIRAMRAAYEGRIGTLESQLKQLTTQQAEGQREEKIKRGVDQALGQPNPVVRPDLLGLSAQNVVRSSTPMTLGGYTEFAYVDRGDRTAEFDQVRTVLEFGAQVHDRIRFYSEWEWEHAAVIAGGEESGGELELEQAWVDLQFHDALNLRAGVILVPLGRYNLYHEGWINNLVDRPLVNRRIGPTTWSEEGIGLHGQALDKDFLGISYEAYVFNPGRAAEVSTGGGFRGVRNEGIAPVYDSLKAGAFRVAFEPARKARWLADTLELGLSGYFSGYKGVTDRENGVNAGGGTMQFFAADLTWEKEFKDLGTFGARGEAIMDHAGPGRKYDPDDPETSLKGQQGWGYYAEAYYSFWPKFLTQSAFGRDFKEPRLVLTLRYDWIDTDRDVLNHGDLGRVTAGLSYRPTPRTVFKFDYQMDHSPSGRPGFSLEESGEGQDTDAFLFGLAVGF